MALPADRHVSLGSATLSPIVFPLSRFTANYRYLACLREVNSADPDQTERMLMTHGRDYSNDFIQQTMSHRTNLGRPSSAVAKSNLYIKILANAERTGRHGRDWEGGPNTIVI
ncbi:hypothetical protein Bbelb_182490 [Branchiostoma belcheri]|nr:hypothetical protein Bbelb_182490 [Branchiostoma belcheri]